MFRSSTSNIDLCLHSNRSQMSHNEVHIPNTSDHDIDELSRSCSSEVETSLYELHPFTNWFHNDELESTFVVSEHDRCFTRFAVALLILFVACIIYLPTESNSDDRIVVIALVTALALTVVATCILWMMRRNAVVAAKRKAEEEQEGPNPSTTVNTTELWGNAAEPRQVGEQEVAFKEGDAKLHHRSRDTAVLKKHDLIHEAFVTIYGFIIVIFGVVYFSRSQSSCLYLLHHHNNQDDHVDCPYNFYPYFIMFASINAHVIGQPRAFFVRAQYVVAIVLLPGIVYFHGRPPSTTLLTWCFYSLFLLFSAILKSSEERKHRERFIAQHKLEQLHADIVEQTASLRAFVLSITPPHLRSRLSSASQTVTVDSSENATCLVVYNRNVVRFMQEVLPTEGAKRLALFRHLTERVLATHAFHMIRSFGDTMYFVSNLFREDHTTTEAAVTNGVKAATEIQVPPKWADTGEHQLQVCCGLAVGALTGLPVGTTCIRYDVFGPVVREAHSLAMSSVAGQLVHVSAQVVSMMGHQLLMYQESNALDADGNKPSPTTTPRSSSALVTGITCVVESHAPSTESTGEDAMPTTLNLSSQNPLYCDNSISSAGEFDVMAKIGQETSGGTKIIRTDISIAPSRNLRLTEACCWQPSEFSDPTIRAEATTARLQRSSHPFATANVMSGLLLGVVVLIASTETNGAGHSPQYVAGTVALGLSSVAQVFVAVRVLVTGEVISVWHQTWAVACQFLSLVFIALLRPSVAGESGVAVHFVFLVGILSMGMGPRGMMFSMVVITLTQLLIEVFVVPRFSRALAFFPLLMLMYVNAAVVSWTQSLLLHSNTAAAEEALQELEVHAQIRQAVMAAVIPPPLMVGTLLSKLSRQSIDVWSVDECVSMVLDIGSMTLAQQQSECNVNAVQQIVQSHLNIVEQAVETTPNKILLIIKVFGSSIMIAGPLLPGGQRNGDGELLTTLACTDAVHVMKSLLTAMLPQTSGGTLYDPLHTSDDVGEFDPEDHSKNNSSLRITAAVALEQGINLLVTTAVPQYELMGPGVTVARGLVAAAAPAPTFMCTEQFAKMYERECVVDAIVEFQPAERWRLRDSGHVQIRRLKVKDRSDHL